jgi:Ca-activated chloride channel family protein
VQLGAPLLLVLLVAVPVLGWLVTRDARSRRARVSRLVALGHLPTLVMGASEAHRKRRTGAVLVGVVALALAAAAPLSSSAPRMLPRQGLDVLFVLDVSRSMRARDVRPDRLERAKAEVSSALDDLVEHRVGLVAFAGTAFLQCPLTTDMEAVRLFLRDLTPDSVPQGGTALAAGLEVARNAFAAEDDAHGRPSDAGTTRAGDSGRKAGRVVVVISDGEDHELVEGRAGEGLKPVGEALKELGVTVVVIGVGSTLGEPIPVTTPTGEISGYVRDRTNRTVVTRMNPEVLGRVAQALGGVFVDGTGAPDLGMNEVFARVAALEKRELESRTVIDVSDASWPALAVAWLALVAWLLGSERARTLEVV